MPILADASQYTRCDNLDVLDLPRTGFESSTHVPGRSHSKQRASPAGYLAGVGDECPIERSESVGSGHGVVVMHWAALLRGDLLAGVSLWKLTNVVRE